MVQRHAVRISRCERCNGLPDEHGHGVSPLSIEGDKQRTVDPSPRSDHPNSAGPEPGGRARPRHAKSILTQPLLTILRGPTVHPLGPRGFLREIFASCGHLSLTNSNAPTSGISGGRQVRWPGNWPPRTCRQSRVSHPNLARRDDS